MIPGLKINKIWLRSVKIIGKKKIRIYNYLVATVCIVGSWKHYTLPLQIRHNSYSGRINYIHIYTYMYMHHWSKTIISYAHKLCCQTIWGTSTSKIEVIDLYAIKHMRHIEIHKHIARKYVSFLFPYKICANDYTMGALATSGCALSVER